MNVNKAKAEMQRTLNVWTVLREQAIDSAEAHALANRRELNALKTYNAACDAYEEAFRLECEANGVTVL